MKFKTAFITALGVWAISVAGAKAEGGGMIVEQTPIAPPPMFGVNVSAGYDTHYMFYGVNYGEHSFWGSVEWSLPFTPDGVDLTIGTWYQNPQDPSPANPTRSDELDLYAILTVDVAPGISWFAQYAAYTYPSGDFNSTNEVGTGIEVSVGDGLADVFVAAYYDWDIEGWNFQTGVSHTEQITDFFGVTVGTAIGYQNDYNALGSDWNDLVVFASFPISLTDYVSLEPYIKHSWSLDAIEAFQDDELFGGVALSIDF